MDLQESLSAQINLVALASAVGKSEGQKVGDEATLEQLASLVAVASQ